MNEDRIGEILKKARQKEERPAKGAASSRLAALKAFFAQFKAPSGLSYIAEKKDDTGIDPRVVAYYAPNSPVSEQYRILRTHLFASKPEAPPKTVILTSSQAGEGKTFTAVNLAITLARDSHKNVLLIDADLRKGQINRIMNLPLGGGLAGVLSGDSEIDGVIQKSRISGLSVITSGIRPSNPAELLGQAKMKELLNHLVGSYDHLILDVPPLISVTDGQVLAPLAEGIILVIKAESTRLEVVQHAQFLIQQAKGKVIGYVLSNVEYHIPEYIHKYL